MVNEARSYDNKGTLLWSTRRAFMANKARLVFGCPSEIVDPNHEICDAVAVLARDAGE